MPSGDAEQTDQPSTGQPANGLPHSGAPKVETPIDTTKWESDPCAVITAEQFSAAGFPSAEGEEDLNSAGGSRSCNWAWPDELSSATGRFAMDSIKDGLSHYYARNEAGSTEYFEPLTSIEGHPALVAMTEDPRESGVCDVDVGLRDDAVYTVQMTADSDSPWYGGPCKAAQELATLAVRTMKGGA